MKKLISIVLFGFIITSSYATINSEINKRNKVDSLINHPTFTSDALSKWKGMKSYTLKVAEVMPENKFNYKPVDEVKMFAEQLIHMANNLYYLSATFLRDTVPPINIKLMQEKVGKNLASKAEIIEYVSKAFDYGEESIKGLDAKKLEEEISFWGGKATKRKIVLLLNDHQTHHRGQLMIYLRLNGIKPPPYIGW